MRLDITRKRYCYLVLKQDLKDSLNYGLYIPPVNGRAGKFLSEERSLKDYSLSSGCSLEVKHMRFR